MRPFFYDFSRKVPMVVEELKSALLIVAAGDRERFKEVPASSALVCPIPSSRRRLAEQTELPTRISPGFYLDLTWILLAPAAAAAAAAALPPRRL